MNNEVIMRLATTADVERVFKWRNMPEIYELGFNRRKVTWKEHYEWYTKIMNNNRHLLWIIEPEAGTVRLNRCIYSAIISIYLLPDYRGNGYGPGLISEACALGFAEWDITLIIAYVVHGNERSVKAFERAGFVKDKLITNITEDKHWRMTLKR